MVRSHLQQSTSKFSQLCLSLIGFSLLATTLQAQTNPYQSLYQRQQQQQSQDVGLPSTSTDNLSDCPDGTPTIECEPSESDQQQSTSGRDPNSVSRDRMASAYTPISPDMAADSRDSRIRRPVTATRRVKEPPTEFQRFVQSSTGHLLPIYGAFLFERVPSTFAPLDRIPVPPDYAVGPGDEISLRVWGQVDFSQRLTVDPAGNIFLPQVGRIGVSGLKADQLQAAIKSAMSRVFRNFDLNVSMGQLRSMQVFVLGQARRPGTYTVSSLSTLVNALFASGGPSARGSLRNIQLKRGTQTVTTLDLYDLLLKGNKTKDASLLPGDVIFIPDAGPRVAIDGSVESPGIYELNNDASLGDLLNYAGGLSPSAAGKRAILERIDQHSFLHSEDVRLTPDALIATHVQSGDIFRILSVVPQFQQTVTLRGNVADPVRFPWHSGMKISELIPSKEALLTRNYWRDHNNLLSQDDRDQAEIEGATGVTNSNKNENGPEPAKSYREEGRKSDVDASLAAATDNSDAVVVRQFIRKNDIQPIAPDIDWSYAAIERLDPVTLTTHIVPFNLGEAVLKHNPSADLELQVGDVVTIFSSADISLPGAQRTKYVRIEGEIKMSGVYSVAPGETLRDVVDRAGGLTNHAYLFAAQFTRESTRREQQRRYNDFLDQLERDINQSAATVSGRVISADQALASQNSLIGQRNLLTRLRQTPVSGRIVLDLQPDSTQLTDLPNLPLENGDRLFIPPAPSTVSVVGMVYNQAAFLYNQDLRLGEYLTDAGGPSRYADRSHIFVIRADGSVISKDARSRLFASRFDNLRMYPGDTLVVPNNTNRVTLLRSLIDWSQVISNFGLGAAAINVLK